mmetsp:Transcript_13734/g.19409  ORF Transcript_13734/g.19409 Transcript_13734/m.19409 type:complete len:458 (-) Transcript_13734:442-1815(-)
MATVDREEEVGKDQRQDCHELHDNVKGRARRVLERITDSVANDSGLVDLRSLWLLDAIDVDASLLNVLFGVVPCSSGVRGRDSHLHTGGNSSSKKACYSSVTEDDASDDRCAHDKDSRRDHFAEGGVRRNLNASRVISRSVARLAGKKSRDALKLAHNLLHHLVGCESYRLHSHSREPVRNHSPDEKCRKDDRRKERDVFLTEVAALDKSTEERKANKASGANSKSFADSCSSVSCSVESVGLLANLLREASHFCNTSSVVTDRSVNIDTKASGKRSEHAESSKRDAKHVQDGKRKVNNESEQKHRDDDALVAEGEAVDDVCCSAGLARLSNFAGRLVRVTGVVFGNKADDRSCPETGPDASHGLEWFAFNASSRHIVDGELLRQYSVCDRDDSERHQESRDADLDLENLFNIRLLANRGQVGGDKRGEEADHDASSRDEQREHDRAPAMADKFLGR